MSTRTPFTPRRESDRRIVSVGTSRRPSYAAIDDQVSPVQVFVWAEAGSNVIAWKVASRVEAEWEGSTWGLERSSSAYGPFRAWVGGLDFSVRECRDDSPPASRLNTRWIYYRVVRALGETREVFGLESWDQDHTRADEVPGVAPGTLGVSSHEVPAVVREMRRRYVAMLTGYIGTPALLYRESWLNPPDSEVVDSRTGIFRGTFGAQGVGTAFEGGYDRPVPLLAKVDFSAQSLSTGASITVDLLQGEQVEVAHWPPPQITDKLRFLDGRIFEITRVVPHQHHGHVIHYTLLVDEVDRENPINGLPLPASFREEARYPRRQAARAMTPEAHYKSLRNGPGARASLLPPEELPPEEDR